MISEQHDAHVSTYVAARQRVAIGSDGVPRCYDCGAPAVEITRGRLYPARLWTRFDEAGPFRVCPSCYLKFYGKAGGTTAAPSPDSQSVEDAHPANPNSQPTP